MYTRLVGIGDIAQDEQVLLPNSVVTPGQHSHHCIVRRRPFKGKAVHIVPFSIHLYLLSCFG